MHLSSRQEEILSLVAGGQTDREIATQLGMSPRTVDSHLRRLFERHNIHSRTQLVATWLLDGGRPVIYPSS